LEFLDNLRKSLTLQGFAHHEAITPSASATCSPWPWKMPSVPCQRQGASGASIAQAAQVLMMGSDGDQQDMITFHYV